MDAATAVETTTIKRRPVILNRGWIETDQILGKFGYGGGDGVCTPFESGLAPPTNTFIRFDLQEEPAGRNDKCFDLSNLQGALALINSSVSLK